MFVNTTNQSFKNLYKDLLPDDNQSPVKKKGIFTSKPNSQCFAKIPFRISDYAKHPFLRKILDNKKTYDYAPQIENSDEELFSQCIAICNAQTDTAHTLCQKTYKEDETSAIETNTNSFIEETIVRTKSIHKSKRKYERSKKPRIKA